MTVPKSPQAAKASADAACEGVVPQSHPGLGSGRGSLDIHDVYLLRYLLQRAYSTRTYIN
eukprot:1876046-Pleurochrysis_carterae.AAC.1